MNNYQEAIEYEVPFEATTDAMAIVEVSESRWRVRRVNGAFEDAFDCRGPTVEGECLKEFLGVGDDGRQLPPMPADGADPPLQVAIPGTDAGLRLRPFDDSTHSLVVITDAEDVDPQGEPGWAQFGGGAIRAVTDVARADDFEGACAGASELLLDGVGFDALAVDLADGPTHLERIDRPIELPASGDGEGAFVGDDVLDPGNDELWGVVMQFPVGERGVMQVAANADDVADPRLARSVELFGQYLGAVLDRQARERKLDAQREELSICNRILRHEVLNGLNLIQGRLDLIERDISEHTRTHYDTIAARVDDLTDRVQAIRAMEKDDEIIETEPRELGPIVREEVASASEKYPGGTFVLVGQVPDLTVTVGDLLHFCLQNVLRNSVQHADADDPRVRVDVVRAGKRAEVRVADNGPGIPDDFDRPVFGQGVSSRDGEGHGEGLFLTRRIVEDSYDGAVRVGESDSGGAAFVLALPLADEGGS